jgi:hypothetical protein
LAFAQTAMKILLKLTALLFTLARLRDGFNYIHRVSRSYTTPTANLKTHPLFKLQVCNRSSPQLF